MKKLELTQAPGARAEMLIRRPVVEVFEAFINPEITTRFWFTNSSGRLEAGRRVTWTWEMYHLSVPVQVKELEANRRILIEWGNHEKVTTVEWLFTSYGDGATFVSIANFGFQGDGNSVVAQALDSKGGFTWVLAGLKAYLEHGIMLNAIVDAFPPGLKEH